MIRHLATAEEQLPDRVVEAFRAHRRDLLGLARLLTGDRDRAEEIVQEAFLTLHRRLDATEPGHELGYLRRAVANQARSGWRRRATARRRQHQLATADVEHHTPEQDAVSHARRDRVDAALAQLTSRQRECAVLTYFGELDGAEVARTLGISEGSAKTHLHRARLALAPLLEELR